MPDASEFVAVSSLLHKAWKKCAEPVSMGLRGKEGPKFADALVDLRAAEVALNSAINNASSTLKACVDMLGQKGTARQVPMSAKQVQIDIDSFLDSLPEDSFTPEEEAFREVLLSFLHAWKGPTPVSWRVSNRHDGKLRTAGQTLFGGVREAQPCEAFVSWVEFRIGEEVTAKFEAGGDASFQRFVASHVASNDDCDPSSKLFIRSLPRELQEDDLRKHFEQYGTIVNVSLPMNQSKDKTRISTKNRGIGFVTFESPESADAAVADSEAHVFFGKLCILQRDSNRATEAAHKTYHNSKRASDVATPRLDPTKSTPAGVTDQCLFVSGLEQGVTQRDVETFFEQFGPLRNCNLPTAKKTGKHRGFCFIEFDANCDGLNKVLAKKSELVLWGKQLVVQSQEAKQDTRAPESTSDPAQEYWANYDAVEKAPNDIKDVESIVVQKVPFDATEDDLHTYFAQFGEIKRLDLPIGRKAGRHRGIAFIHYDVHNNEAEQLASEDGEHFILGAQIGIKKMTEQKPPEAEKAPKAASRSRAWEASGWEPTAKRQRQSTPSTAYKSY